MELLSKTLAQIISFNDRSRSSEVIWQYQQQLQRTIKDISKFKTEHRLFKGQFVYRGREIEEWLQEWVSRLESCDQDDCGKISDHKLELLRNRVRKSGNYEREKTK